MKTLVELIYKKFNVHVDKLECYPNFLIDSLQIIEMSGIIEDSYVTIKFLDIPNDENRNEKILEKLSTIFKEVV